MSIKGIIAGLGNPGGQYEKTRHNIGFMVINKLITITSASKLSGKKFYCELWKTTTIIDNYKKELSRIEDKHKQLTEYLERKLNIINQL